MSLGDGIRRDVAKISQEERNLLRDAFIELNHRFYPGRREDEPAGGVSWWFKQDEIHRGSDVHGGPAFLPWHRELCNRLEALLREVNPELSLHYWDWNTDPRRSPDGRAGYVNLFSPDFMGQAKGLAGEPWLKAGFYDPNADPFRSDFGHDPNNNPFDPPRYLMRNLPSGMPNLGVSDQTIIGAETYQAMRGNGQNGAPRGLEFAHNWAHGYIGGTISSQHISFRDPFVFLLHSNVDRLFALWQLQPGKEWRLDPEQVYGSEGNSTASGKDVGILTPLEPWAGVDAPGKEEGVLPIRPWAPPENEQLKAENQKNSKHPSVVAPPRYAD